NKAIVTSPTIVSLYGDRVGSRALHREVSGSAAIQNRPVVGIVNTREKFIIAGRLGFHSNSRTGFRCEGVAIERSWHLNSPGTGSWFIRCHMIADVKRIALNVVGQLYQHKCILSGLSRAKCEAI